MKKISMVFVALLLCFTMAALSPAQVIAATSDSAKHQYISEVKVGMGATSEEAAAELLAEGFTILKEDGGSYADLNYEAGTKSGMKKGPTQKVVYLGYKTTDDPKKAITDLAVMNMNGGYSVEDYNILMNNYLEGQIKPFVNRFIATLNEYRENYQKPKDSLNHIRADYYRQMLNKLTDDDTGNKPLGDLLLNETKYEMGDEKYNALSEAEKKNHADILTLLTQGNGQAVMLMEGLVAKAADTADNSWMERISDFDLDVLKAKVKKDNPNLSTEADINAELDKQYYDIAMKLTCYDRVPYIEKMEATTSDSQNILRWEYVMQANSKSHIDLNEGAIWFDSDYRAPDNRISMFAQREDGSVKPSAEITGGYVDETEDIGYIKMVK